jgi:hypothetical protein
MRSRSGARDSGISLLLALLFFTRILSIRNLAAVILNRTRRPRHLANKLHDAADERSIHLHKSKALKRR